MRSIFSSTSGSLEDVINRANELLEDARKESNSKKALKLCDKAKSKIEDAEKIFIKKNVASSTRDDGIANAYHSLGEICDELKRPGMAKEINRKAESWGYIHKVTLQTGSPSHEIGTGSVRNALFSVTSLIATPSVVVAAFHDVPDPNAGQHKDRDISQQAPICSENKTLETDVGTPLIPQEIFSQDIVLPVAKYGLPEDGAPIASTLQLAYYLSLLQPPLVSTDGLDESEGNSLQPNIINPDEQDRLRTISTNMVRAFIREKSKRPDGVTEIVCLAAVLDRDNFRELLHAFVDGIGHSVLLKDRLLDGLALLISNATPGYLDSDDLVKILGILKIRLEETHQQSTRYTYQLSSTISHVLDSMVDYHVVGLKREQLHAPLSGFLKQLQDSSDSALIYQSAYAYQALQHIPDDENILQAVIRRTGRVLEGVSGIVSAVKALDVKRLFDGIQDIQKGLGGVYDAVMFVNDTYENAKKLSESGKDFLDCLQEGFNFSRRSAWYPVLRGLDTLLQEGYLMEFEKTIREAPCRLDPAFQWGVCQRLGEIVVNHVWDTNIRRCAINFLGEMYKDDVRWGRQADIKQWILYILTQSTESPDTTVANHARELLQELKSNGNAMKQALFQVGSKESPGLYPLMPILPPEKSPLLEYVQKNPDIEAILCRIRRERRKKNYGDIYISPRAKPNLFAEESFDLTFNAQEFLKSDKKVFLLLGDSGAGKSTFNKALEASLWDDYKKDGRIPLFIHLPSIDKPEHDLVGKHLLKSNFSEQQIRELKMNREFILICDGYDECQQTSNLYTSNLLNQPLGWRAQMIISCRSEYIGGTYKNRFQPTDRNAIVDSGLFQEAVVTPFNNDQIQNYIDQYVSSRTLLWESKDYHRALKDIPNLKDLVKNPFLLRLALDVIPILVGKGSDFPTVRITRVELYDKFLDQWIRRNEVRLEEMDLGVRDKENLLGFLDGGFKQHGFAYLKELATAVYDNQDGIPVIKYSEVRDRKSWKEPFFSLKGDNKLLREAIPLVRSSDQYGFIHASVLEYGLSLAIFDPDAQEEYTEPSLGPTHPAAEESASSIAQLLETPLGRRNFVGEPSVLQFLVERAQQHPPFKRQLHAIIHQSKFDETVQIAAANAITVLVRARVQFNGADLRGIRIPGADLSYGVFDSVRFEGADLQNVNLRHVWLRNGNLSGAQMTGVHFGELPCLQEDGEVDCCACSPDGRVFAVGLTSGVISLYEASSWKRIRKLEGHSGEVKCLEFSATCNELVSGSSDMTVRLWDVASGSCTQTFESHERGVTCVTYLLNGDQIASGSWDTTVRLWDCKTGECFKILQGHEYGVFSVAYSSKRNQIASGSSDGTMRLWDAVTGSCTQILKEHSATVRSIVYSPNGDLFASGGYDDTIRLWDIETGKCVRTIKEHSREVTSVVFSPKGDLIVSGSVDMTVRLWDVETGICAQTFQGHSKKVSSVVFLPNGNQIASGSLDRTVRLWNIDNGKFTQKQHEVSVGSMAHSPNGDLIASGGPDDTTSLWDAKTGNRVHALLPEFSPKIQSSPEVAFSPSGDLIAIGSFSSPMRLWNTETMEYIQVFPSDSRGAQKIVFAPNGGQIASKHYRVIRLWDVETGNFVLALEDHSDWISQFVYSPKGDQIASGSNDKTVRLWDVVTGACIHTFHGHDAQVYSVAYSPKGGQIASGSWDKLVKVWDVETGNCIFNLEGHGKFIPCVIYSPKGDWIASGSGDSTVRLWNIETGECLRILEGHSEGITNFVLSPNGDLIASTSMDKTFRLWNIENGQCLATISGFNGDVTSIFWESNGQYLVTGSLDKSMRRWQIIKEGVEYKVLLCWSSSHDALTASGVSLNGVQGLNQMDMKLLSQRGALITTIPNPEQ